MRPRTQARQRNDRKTIAVVYVCIGMALLLVGRNFVSVSSVLKTLNDLNGKHNDDFVTNTPSSSNRQTRSIALGERERENDEDESEDNDEDNGDSKENSENDGKNKEKDTAKDKDGSTKNDNGDAFINVIETNNTTEEPKFLFVHVGKAGGSTIYKNIRNLCLIKNVANNMAQLQTDLPVATTPCTERLNDQANPEKFNPSTEMKISTDDMVVGSIHTNQKSWWWNADDDGDSNNPHNEADQIRWILSFGKEQAWNETLLRNPSYYEGNDHGLRDATAFLIPVRDPLDRLVSAFNYHHPSNKIKGFSCEGRRQPRYWSLDSFYCQCFPTVNDLADVFVNTNTRGGGKNKKNMKFVKSHDVSATEKTSCLDVAETILRGKSTYQKWPTNDQFEADNALDKKLMDFGETKSNRMVPFIEHLSINYGFYYRRTLAKRPRKDIVAIRTEHLYQDLQALEHSVGGTAKIDGNSTGHRSETYNSDASVVSDTVTDPKRLQALCCAIASEAAIYIELIERASNLAPLQKKETLDAFSKKCNLDRCGEKQEG